MLYLFKLIEKCLKCYLIYIKGENNKYFHLVNFLIKKENSFFINLNNKKYLRFFYCTVLVILVFRRINKLKIRGRE